MKIKLITPMSLLIVLLISCGRNESPFTIGSKSVEEGEYRARALSPIQMSSSYPMVLDSSIPQPIRFKLSLNGKDNEAGFGQNHHLVVPADISEFYAPLLKFGRQSPPTWDTPGDRAAHQCPFPRGFTPSTQVL